MAKAEAAKEAVAAVAGKEAAEGAAKMGMAVKVKNKKPLGSLFKHDLFLPSPMFSIRSSLQEFVRNSNPVFHTRNMLFKFEHARHKL